MPWQEFIDVEFIKLNGKHMSGALVALVVQSAYVGFGENHGSRIRAGDHQTG